MSPQNLFLGHVLLYNFKSAAGTGWTGSQPVLKMTSVWQFMPERTFSRHGATQTAMTKTRNGFVRKHKTTGVNVFVFPGNGGRVASPSRQLLVNEPT